MTKKPHILILNGPNINMLGVREPQKYGLITLNEVIKYLNTKASKFNVKLEHFQSNAEHEIINHIHQAKGNKDYILINPAAFTYTSIAIRDALLSVNIPFIEIHLSNTYKQETFRHRSYLSDIAVGVIHGLGVDGYFYALQAAIQHLSKLKTQEK